MANDGSGCPVPQGSENYGNRGTSWHPMLWISLACLGATTAISMSLIVLHLRRYRAPKEQRQIIRIVFSVIAYSLVAFFELFEYRVAQYIDPVGDVYEAFGLCALFLLFLQYAAPKGTFDDSTFEAVKSAEETETAFNWPKISWVFVFQYPILEVLCVALQEATQVTGHYCLNSLNPKYAHLWVEIVESISIAFCVLAIWRFRQRFRSLMKVKRGLSKLLCFKIIVFIRFAQQWVFSLFLEYHVIKTSSSYSYNDILYGIPATATCVEMVLFAGAFWYAFSSTEYGSDVQGHVQRLPVWKAVLDALNPTDIIGGIVRLFPLCIELSKSGDWKKWRKATAEQSAIHKGIKKYKNRKGGQNQDGFSKPDTEMEALTRPSESYHSPDLGRASISGGLGYQGVYQPPESSPPYEESGYLMVDGRPRASSQSSLMAEAAPYQGSRARSPSDGAAMQPRYGASRSPSPSRFVEAPMEGKDMV